jgi:hypothetical protein
MTKIYHPYWLWEENRYNMWGEVDNQYARKLETVDFMIDTNLFGVWMMKVVNDWRYSCEQNLNNGDGNRRAWIGQAAVAYASQVPEHITRQAWAYLTEEQKKRADDKADEAILRWETEYAKQNKTLCKQMEIPWISDGNTRRSPSPTRGNEQSPKLQKNSKGNTKK